MPGQENVVSTGEIAEKLSAFQSEALDPRVVQFGRFLSGRLEPKIDPDDFIMTAACAAYDLKIGQDGFSGETIENDLVGLDNEAYDAMLEGLADIADAVFPKDFAQVVRDKMVKSGVLAPPEPNLGEALSDGEIITETIDDIDTAVERIVDDARQRTTSLDWEQLGISEEQVTEAFDLVYPLAFQSASCELPLNLMVDEKDQERGLITELFPSQKKLLFGKYYLAMLSPISPEMATFTRDYLLLKALAMVAATQNLDPDSVVEHFLKVEQGPLSRAATRGYAFLQENPHILR